MLLSLKKSGKPVSICEFDDSPNEFTFLVLSVVNNEFPLFYQ